MIWRKKSNFGNLTRYFSRENSLVTQSNQNKPCDLTEKIKLLESCLVSYSKVAWPPCMYCKMAYLESLSPPPLWWWIFADAATLIWDVNVDLRQTRNRTWNHRCYYHAWDHDPFLHLQMNCYSGRVGRIADGLIFGCGEVGTAWFPHWLMMKSHRNDPFCYCYWKIVRKQGEKVFYGISCY